MLIAEAPLLPITLLLPVDAVADYSHDPGHDSPGEDPGRCDECDPCDMYLPGQAGDLLPGQWHCSKSWQCRHEDGASGRPDKYILPRGGRTARLGVVARSGSPGWGYTARIRQADPGVP